MLTRLVTTNYIDSTTDVSKPRNNNTPCPEKKSLQYFRHNFFSTSDEGRLTLLVSLDLSAAFDMIDHAVLLERLTCSFGVTGTVALSTPGSSPISVAEVSLYASVDTHHL